MVTATTQRRNPYTPAPEAGDHRRGDSPITALEIG